MPNKRVYSISIFRFFPTLLALFLPYLICKFSTLLVYWALFSTLLIYLALLFYEIYLKYPPYLFIWPYLFNWHLRVPTFITKMYGNFFAINQMHQKELVKILVMVVGNVPNLILSSLLFLQFRPNAIEFI